MIKIGDVIEGTINMNTSGSAYLVNNELPRDIYIHKNNTNRSLHLDTVKIKIVKGNGRQLEGIVTDVLKRFKTEFVGIIQISPRYAFFIPDSTKMSIDMFIPLNKLNGAKDGQKVVAKLTSWKEDSKSPNGEIIKVLGNAGDNDVEIHAILHDYDLPYDFDENVIDESEAIPSEIKQSEIDARRDMRDVPTFTIDPEDAKDFDDALSVQWVNGQLEVGIHIADVSHYLRPDTDLDKEAYRRGTSVYLVDRVVPMLPERLSNGLCSLRPNEDKLCFSAVFTLDQNGTVVDEWYGRTIINSDYRYTYEQAQAAIEDYGNGIAKRFNELSEHANVVAMELTKKESYDAKIRILDSYAKKLRKQRLKEGSITFDKQEVKFKLDDNNKPIDIIFKVMKDSNKLIEEFMLLANKKVAELLNENEYPVINRVHDEPSQEKLGELKNFVKLFGYDIKTTNAKEITQSLNKLLIDVKGKPEDNMINNLVVRTMQKAAYSTKNIGHYGLAFENYAHFTSPIRRYPDVMVHRLLSRFLENKPVPKLDKLETRCVYLSEREKRAQKAERDSIKYMQTIYMSERVGKIYKGIITSVTDYGIFIEITENKCEGLIKLSEIGGDTYIPDLKHHCLKGHNTGHRITLGDEVNVVVSSVDVEKKNINFTLLRL
jgi:ribonuclease R/exosome complex exonuclease DIS3/RRP44